MRDAGAVPGDDQRARGLRRVHRQHRVRHDDRQRAELPRFLPGTGSGHAATHVAGQPHRRRWDADASDRQEVVVKRRGEEGLMLQDLLFAMMITTMLVIALTSSMFVIAHTLGSTESRVDQSNGGTLMASYFGPDVQNALTVGTNVNETSACSSPMNADLLLSTGGNSSVSYYRGSGADASTLYRRTCSNGAASAPARLARHLAAPPTFSCAPDCGDATWRSVTATVIQL